MNKKILIGSIVIVTVLIGGLFTSVVSYGSVKSTSALNSPLFNIRSSKAIGKESKDIDCDYVGKGEETDIPLSSRLKKAEQVQKAIDIISKMNDRALINYFGRIITQKQMTDKEKSDLLQALHYIRENPNVMKYYDMMNIPIAETHEYWSCGAWRPGCTIYLIYEILLFTLFVIVGTITNIFSCQGYTTDCVCLNN